jgi:23S rRNA (uracil1939-C5)-methyltransferase
MTDTSPSNPWQQGAQVELTIEDLNDTGEGVGRFEQRVVFVPDTVPGDRIRVRLVHVKPRYAHGLLQELLEASPHRIRPHCIVADKCGGCQWQHIDETFQAEAKHNQVVQALKRIGEFANPPVEPILAASMGLGYRNKATYPVARSEMGQVKVGYYRKGSHQVVNLNQCPVQDPRLNPLLAGIKQDIQAQGWSIYDEQRHEGQIRHLGLRVGWHTGEILLTVVTSTWELPGVEEQAQRWLEQYPGLVGVMLNCNPDRNNVIFGPETHHLVGRPFVRETLAGVQFLIHPTTFFQVNTVQAEALINLIVERLNLQRQEVIVDAYCGIGTLSLPLAQRAEHVLGIEVQAEAVEQAQVNAELNGLTNVQFRVGKVAARLQELTLSPDVVVLDPPRKGCEAEAIAALLSLRPDRIVYVSCRPATLARDLKVLCAGGYRLEWVKPVDFFPQTAHVECVALLAAA